MVSPYLSAIISLKSPVLRGFFMRDSFYPPIRSPTTFFCMTVKLAINVAWSFAGWPPEALLEFCWAEEGQGSLSM